MHPIINFVLTSLLITAVIYPTIAGVLIVTDRPAPPEPDNNDEPLTFNALMTVDYTALPERRPYPVRDGSELFYRFYESSSAPGAVMILLHGSGWHSMQFHPLATTISDAGAAHVVTPDLRGHGIDPQRRGDIDYINQLEDDLADLIDVLKEQYPDARIIVGGHSSGGGLVIRFAGGEHGSLADGYVLLAPFLKYNAPTTRTDSGGWARPNSRRIAGLTMLNNIGIRWFNDLTVIQFAMPQDVLDGPLGETATTSYTYRLNTGFAPRLNYERDLAAMQQPFLLVAGLDDASFISERYEPTINQHTASGTYVLLPDTGHIDLLTNPGLASAMLAWLAAE